MNYNMIERMMIDDGSIGLPDYLREYLSETRPFWLMVYLLTGLVPFSFIGAITHPIGIVRRVWWRFKQFCLYVFR